MRIKRVSFYTSLVILVAALTATEASARIGSGRSSGSKGSRSYSVPNRSYQQPSPYRTAPQPSSPAPFPQRNPSGGGFLRSMAGGLLGGFAGAMLFRSLGFGSGGFAGGGIGLFDILLLAGIAYLLYRFVAKRREAPAGGYPSGRATVYDYIPPASAPSPTSTYAQADDAATGVAHIRQMDPSFDEGRFKDQAMDLFFRIQGAWMHRDHAVLGDLLTPEMAGIIGRDIEDLKAKNRINRLENIAVRNTDIVEAWQESGADFITIRFLANLLDYTVDEISGNVLEGSRTEPVKFEEYWTFTRPVGSGRWRLSAITQP